MIDRRELLTMAAVGAVTSVMTSVARAENRAARLVLVHGRGQKDQTAQSLRDIWLEALKKGAQKLNRTLPENLDVTVPFYGKLLDDFTAQMALPLTEDIRTKGSAVDDDFLRFQAQMAEEIRQQAGITDAQIDAEYGPNPRPKGPLNWEWVQAILRTLDKHGGGLGQTALEIFTRDVYLYTTRLGVRDQIDAVVRKALTPDVPCVVVGHSLGSVVAYNVLRSESRQLRMPSFVTVGSPLGIRAVRNRFLPLRFPQPASAWFNAFDERDVVALYPLDNRNFPVSPAITNDDTVKNHTRNRHGIIGYLDDDGVAKVILDALGV